MHTMDRTSIIVDSVNERTYKDDSEITNSTNANDPLSESVGIFVRKLIGQNKKISLVQKRSIVRQIENYIHSKITPGDNISEMKRAEKQTEMYRKLLGVVEKMESYTRVTRFGIEIKEPGDEKTELHKVEVRHLDVLLDKLSEGIDRLIVIVNNKVRRLATELELCGEVLGCRKWGYRAEESHSLHGLIIKLQTDHSTKVTSLTEEVDMLKVFLEEHQINLQNIEQKNLELTSQIEDYVSESDELRHTIRRMNTVEGEITEVTNQLRESERRCHILESQLSHLKPTMRSKPEPAKKKQSYVNITALYCNRPTLPQLTYSSNKMPKFLSHLK